MRIVRRTRADLDLAKADWRRVSAATDVEIGRQIAADADTAPVFSVRELKRARRVVPAPAAGDVRAIRQRLGLSQQQFAARYGFSVETIRNYEQGHRRPAGPARVLLKVIAVEPDAVTRALLQSRAAGKGAAIREGVECGRSPRKADAIMAAAKARLRRASPAVADVKKSRMGRALKEVIEALPAGRRGRVKARAAELIAEEKTPPPRKAAQ